jgi:hypothetical protein
VGKLTATMQKVVTGQLTLPSGCSNEYLFPNMVWTNDHMHMYFNSLQETVVKDADWGRLEHQLRYGVVAFLNNNGLRQRFQSLLPKHERQKFQNFSRTHVDWKWEYLENALGQMEPIIDDLLRLCHCQTCYIVLEFLFVSMFARTGKFKILMWHGARAPSTF